MKFLQMIVCFGLITSCGVRPEREKLPMYFLSGLWESVDNDPNGMHEKIALNSDNTFWWREKQNELSHGTFGVDGNNLNFIFTEKAPRVYQFSVDDVQLKLVKDNVEWRYVRIPTTTGNNEACPCGGNGSKNCPDQKPPKPTPDQNPDQNPDQKPQPKPCPEPPPPTPCPTPEPKPTPLPCPVCPMCPTPTPCPACPTCPPPVPCPKCPPTQNPPDQNPPGQNPPGQNPPGQNPPGQNPPRPCSCIDRALGRC